MKSRDVIKALLKDGWKQCHQKGSHCQFKHPEKSGRVTVPHPKKDLPKKTVQSIFNLESSVDTRFIAHHLDSSSYLKICLNTSKVSAKIFNTLSKSICYTLNARATEDSRFKQAGIRGK